jgi:membrane-bound lytic murein transglycosylase B
VPATEVDAALPAMVFPLVMKEGTEYWLGFDNFFVITRYNRAIHYAMSVFELAREIRALRPGPASTA